MVTTVLRACTVMDSLPGHGRLFHKEIARLIVPRGRYLPALSVRQFHHQAS